MLNKDKILEVITDWSHWSRKLPPTTERPTYQAEIARKITSGQVLTIKGVRRSGKSTLLLNEVKRLRSEGMRPEDILVVNLEDPRFINDLSPSLLDRIKDTFLEYMAPSTKPVIMLDEVQNVPGWEKWVVKEHDLKRSSVYVTGSSSSLLDSDLGTPLSGRYLDVTVFPLSFQEFLLFNGVSVRDQTDRVQNRNELIRLYRRYADQGGFPKLAEIADEETRRDILKVYYDSILLRDIMARHTIGNPRALEELTVFLLSNAGSINSINKLKNNFGMSFDAVNEYTTYLERAYLIFQLPKFDWSVKKQLVNPRKFYSIDTGLSNRVSFQVGSRKAQNLENIVFVELMRRKQEIYYLKTPQKREVDFVVKQGARITQLIQVCLNAEDPQTLKRELSAFAKAEKELADPGSPPIAKTLLTLEPIGVKIDNLPPGVKIRDVIDWLLFP